MKRTAALAAILTGVAMTTAPMFAATKLTIAGSTALNPLVKASADAYQKANPDVDITVNGGGSGVGINQVAAKAIDIGMSDILAPSQPSLVDHKVAVVAFAVITNPGVGVKNLTKKQIQDIFSGVDTNWNQVGGPDQKIVVVNRTRGSGTRVVFEKTVIAPAKVAEGGLSVDSTGTVVSYVGQTPGAISYAAWSGTKGKPITEVSIDGVAPEKANVVVGKYPFWSYEHMFTNGPATPDEQKFIDYVTNDQATQEKLLFIRPSEMKTSETDR